MILNQSLSCELKVVTKWMKSKSLAVRLSVLKTNYILFHSKKLKPCKSFNLLIDRVNIKQVPTAKYVDVTSDSNCSNLTWKYCIDELCLQLSKAVGILCKPWYYNNIDKLTLFYYSLIYLFLTHSIYIRNLTYPTYLKPVTTLQKQIVLMMTFSESLLLKFRGIPYHNILSFVYQWFHKITVFLFYAHIFCSQICHPQVSRSRSVCFLSSNHKK